VKRIPRWGWIAASVVAAIVLLRLTLLRPRPVEVDAYRVARGMVEDAVTNSQAGTVKSRHRARLSAERAGRVESIPHREGAAVARGAVLVQLDESTTRKQLDVARREHEALAAALDAARANAVLADQQFERTERLFKDAMVSAGEMDQARSRRDAAQGELRAAQARAERAAAAVRVAQDDLDHMRVVAPFDGVVAARLVEVGETVSPGLAVIEVVNLRELYVSAAIDEVDIGRLREQLPARISLDPFPGVIWQGRVARVFPVVDETKEQNRTLQVEVELPPDPAKPQPRPGTSADVEIVIARRDSVLRVPSYAVMDGRRVLVVERGKAVTREVRVGLRNWEWTEVQEGLREGERVVTSLDRQGVVAGAYVRERGAAGGAAPR
jgi:HlyD family secretion protein